MSGRELTMIHDGCRALNLPEDSVPVTDADEEIFDLYSALASQSPRDKSGLGFIDSTKDVLEIELRIEPGPSVDPAQLQSLSRAGKRGHGRRGKEKEKLAGLDIHAELAQDVGALRNRSGDTGSVLWRSSQFLAKHLLTQFYFPPSDVLPLLARTLSDPCRKPSVLELGTGTGLLPVLLHPLFSRYVTSDRLENLKLVAKNLRVNGVWIAGGAPAVMSPPSSPKIQKRRLKPDVTEDPVVEIEEIDWEALPKWKPGQMVQDGMHFDLVLAVDCIYNEHLTGPLVEALATYCGPKTMVWVVAELRSADVLQLFLETWLNHPSGPWSIVRLPPSAMGEELSKGSVGWVGWRPGPSS